jgi:deoxyribose-phosphate aldolase
VETQKLIETITKEVIQRLQSQNVTLPEISGNLGNWPGKDVACAIEHSAMTPEATEIQVMNACMDTRKYRFANICVFPYFVAFAAELLRGSGIVVCTSVAFPHGAFTTETKIHEAKAAIMDGAAELDVALNISAVKSGKFEEARNDIEAVIAFAKGKAKIKVIYEQGSYNEEEKIKVLNIVHSSGADFIKIQNFLTGKKAIPEDVEFVRSVVGKDIGIKIDGGVTDAPTLRILLAAGADRVGCSRSVKIVTGI